MQVSWRLQYSAPFGVPVVPGREHDGDRALRVVGEDGRCFARDAQVGQQLVGRGGRRDLDRVERGRAEPGCREHDSRLRSLEHGIALGGGEPVVHARGDRAELRGGEIGDDVLGRRREDQCDDIAHADTPTRHPTATSSDSRSSAA